MICNHRDTYLGCRLRSLQCLHLLTRLLQLHIQRDDGLAAFFEMRGDGGVFRAPVSDVGEFGGEAGLERK